MTATEIENYMISLGDEKQRQILVRFFKTEKPGDYGYGDKFLGIKNPTTHEVVRECRNLPLEEVPALLTSEWHEVRLCGFLILVDKFGRLCAKSRMGKRDAIEARDAILNMYLEYADRADNWDLVDLSAPKIVGKWLLVPSSMTQEEKISVLDSLAYSDSLWKKRISMVCTWAPTSAGNAFYVLRYARIHLDHPHDLMHKAVGWMLREMGKRVSMDLLRDFLDDHISEMSRTTLRYAIEKMPVEERQYWMNR